jgi:hypothetical protein
MIKAIIILTIIRKKTNRGLSIEVFSEFDKKIKINKLKEIFVRLQKSSPQIISWFFLNLFFIVR